MDTAPRLPRGRLCVGDSGIPIHPPPLRGTSFHRKEGMTTRAPSFGRGCRAQRGGVGFLFLRRSRLLFAFPIGEGGPRQRRSGAFVNGVLETIFPDLFSYRFPHPTSAPSGHLLPMEGGSVHASPFQRKGMPSAARRGWLSFLRRSGAFVNCLLETIFFALFHTARTLSGSLRSPPSPRGEGGPHQRWIGYSRKRRT